MEGLTMASPTSGCAISRATEAQGNLDFVAAGQGTSLAWLSLVSKSWTSMFKERRTLLDVHGLLDFSFFPFSFLA